MKKRMEKLGAGLLALALSLTLCPAARAAESCAGGHTWEEKTVRTGSHLYNGVVQQVCGVCGLEGSQRLLDRQPYHFNEPYVGREAAEDHEGEVYWYCTDCGNAFNAQLPRLTAQQAAAMDCGEGNHDFQVLELKHPTCKDSGITMEVCRTCGATGDYTVYQLTDHTFERTVLQAPTAEQEGRAEYRCTVCGTAYTELLDRVTDSGEEPETPHQHTWTTETSQADCTHDGSTVKRCAECGEEVTLSTTPKLGHNYRSEVTRPATAEEEGVRTYTCTRCGDSYTESIDKLPSAGGRKDSGSTALSKLSESEIRALLKSAPKETPTDLFVERPSINAPYTTGKATDTALNAALARLNALRRIAGLPSVTLDDALNESAQYGAVITAHNGKLNHYPSKVSDMDDAFYQKAYSATSSSNLAAGYDLVASVDGFMADNDMGNLPTVGHRRWQLNPTMGKVGFGVATEDSGYAYVAEKVFDRSGKGCDYDYISWPASGSFPQELFSGSHPWSVTLNPQLYTTPSASRVKVTVSNEDGDTWVLDSSRADGYFNVNTGGYGVGNCIIFRPDGVQSYDGTYTVTITGLQDRSGKDTQLTFETDFFQAEDSGSSRPSGGSQTPSKDDSQTNQKPDTAQKPDNSQNAGQNTAQQPGQNANQTPSQTTQTVFSDVGSTHWAADAIRTAVKQGIVNGYADGRFRPANQVTNGHFNLMMARAFYKTELSAASGSDWWDGAVAVNQAHGLTAGTAMAASPADRYGLAISRYDMAQLMYNLLKDQKAQLPSASARKAAQSAIKDWSSIPQSYREAVSVCYAMGLLQGRTDGTFGGSAVMNRAQGCTVICRLWSQLNG